MVAVTTDTEGRASQLALIRGKMRQIEKVIAALNGVSTSVEDVLGGDGLLQKVIIYRENHTQV